MDLSIQRLYFNKHPNTKNVNFSGNIRQDAFEQSLVEFRKLTVCPIKELDVIKKVNKLLINNSQKPVIFGVTGKSGAGKTTLIKNAIDIANVNAPELATHIDGDMYYKDKSQFRKHFKTFLDMLKGGIDFDNPEAINLELLNKHLAAIKNNITFKMPKYTYGVCKSNPNGKIITQTKLPILDQIFSLINYKNYAQKNPLVDVGISIELSDKTLWDRYLPRSIARGMTSEEAKFLYGKAQAGAKKFQKPEFADIRLDGETDLNILSKALAKMFEAICLK